LKLYLFIGGGGGAALKGQ